MKFKVESVTTCSPQTPHVVGECDTLEAAEQAVSDFIKSIQEPWDNWIKHSAYQWSNGFIHQIHIRIK